MENLLLIWFQITDSLFNCFIRLWDYLRSSHTSKDATTYCSNSTTYSREYDSANGKPSSSASSSTSKTSNCLKRVFFHPIPEFRLVYFALFVSPIVKPGLCCVDESHHDPSGLRQAPFKILSGPFSDSKSWLFESSSRLTNVPFVAIELMQLFKWSGHALNKVFLLLRSEIRSKLLLFKFR